MNFPQLPISFLRRKINLLRIQAVKSLLKIFWQQASLSVCIERYLSKLPFKNLEIAFQSKEQLLSFNSVISLQNLFLHSVNLAMVIRLCQTGIVLQWKLALKLQIRKKCETKRIVVILGREISFTLPELQEEVVYRRKYLNYFPS